MSDRHGDLGLGFRQPRIALSDQRTGAVIELPGPVAVALLGSEPKILLTYQRYAGMAGQWAAPPEQRGQLIIFDQELVRRVLADLSAEALCELQAEFPDSEKEPEQEDCFLDHAAPHRPLSLDRHLKTSMGDLYDPDSPSFIAPVRRKVRSARE